MSSFGLLLARHSKNRKVYTFGAPAGENNFTRLADHHARGAFTRFVKKRPGLTPQMVNTRWITPNFPKVRQHSRAHLRVQGSGRIIIEINGAHTYGKPGGGWFFTAKRS